MSSSFLSSSSHPHLHIHPHLHLHIHPHLYHYLYLYVYLHLLLLLPFFFFFFFFFFAELSHVLSYVKSQNVFPMDFSIKFLCLIEIVSGRLNAYFYLITNTFSTYGGMGLNNSRTGNTRILVDPIFKLFFLAYFPSFVEFH
uniref:Uncharacterized protein n=1 Tax=Cacopsylla melanoneura TaxID=428564 RepID=A0A8D8UTG2_9HEMI